MPSIFNQSGFTTTARAGIYARIDASALAGGDIESGNVALIGDFPSFQNNVPALFSSRRSMTAYDTSDNDLATLAQLAFNPSDDQNANRGVSSLRVVNARDNMAQASIDLGMLTLKSKVWGNRGNRLISTLAISGDTHTLDLSRNGITEQFKIENDIYFKLENTSGANVDLTIDNGVVTLSGANINNITINNTSLEAPLLKDVVTLLNQVVGVTVTLIDPSSVAIASFDHTSETVADTVIKDIKAPNYRLHNALITSTLVTSSIDTTQAGALSAGSITATGAGQGNTFSWESALQSIENENVQIVVLFSTDSGAQSKLANHLKLSALAGYERQAYTAIEKTSTLAQIKTRAVSLNHEGIALVAQDIEIFDPKGLRTTLDSRYLALALAGMQAGSDIGEPLTRKRPNVIKTLQTFNTHNDAEQALRSGLLFLSMDNLGVKVERGITTYLTDNNPIFSEISTYESVLTSLRDLRQALADQIGRPTRASQIALLEGRVKTRLTAQVRDGIIKNFKGVSLEDLGDEVAISYEVAPVEPLNFISITAIATRNI